MPSSYTTIAIHDKVERVPIGLLKPNNYNPNKMNALDKRSLEHGIRTEGFIDPIHAQKETGIIIDGEHRWRIAKKIGMKLIPVIYLDVDDAQARKLTLAFINRRGSTKGPDVAMVLKDIQELSKNTLKQLELDTAIARKDVKEMLAQVDVEAGVAQQMVKKASAKNAAKKDKVGKVSADPAEPEDNTFTESVIGNDEVAEMHQFPITFFAPTIEARELIKALCDDKHGELSYTNLQKLVDYYLKKHPKKAAKVLAAVAAE